MGLESGPPPEADPAICHAPRVGPLPGLDEGGSPHLAVCGREQTQDVGAPRHYRRLEVKHDHKRAGFDEARRAVARAGHEEDPLAGQLRVHPDEVLVAGLNRQGRVAGGVGGCPDRYGPDASKRRCESRVDFVVARLWATIWASLSIAARSAWAWSSSSAVLSPTTASQQL